MAQGFFNLSKRSKTLSFFENGGFDNAISHFFG
jgi:hypothetical protein